MKKHYISADIVDYCFAVILIILVSGLIFVPILVRNIGVPEDSNDFGRFIEIERERYVCPSGDVVDEFMVYDKDTYIVYVYCVDNHSLSITPFLMRDSFGQLTVGVYDIYGDIIVPAELCDMEEDIWVLVG